MKVSSYVDGKPISRIADQALVELDHLFYPTGGTDFKRSVGRIEGLSLAISILAGGEIDEDTAAKPQDSQL